MEGVLSRAPHVPTPERGSSHGSLAGTSGVSRAQSQGANRDSGRQVHKQLMSLSPQHSSPWAESLLLRWEVKGSGWGGAVPAAAPWGP